MDDLKRIKVLHVITRLDKGGSATNTLETMARLNQNIYDATLIYGKTEDPRGEIAAFIKKHHISAVFLPSLRREVHPFWDLMALIRLYRFMRKTQWDIVHTHSSKAGILGRWAAWLARVKVIVHTPHGHIFYGYFNKTISRFYVLVERWTAGMTDKIITLTEKGKADHIRYKIAPAEKFVPIYSGIDIEYYSARSREDTLRASLSIPEDVQVIGSVSRLDPVKGNQTLLEAYILLAEEFPYVNLLLVGDGSEREKLEGMAQKAGLKERVIFAGFREDIPELLALMDIFVLASLNEGMGRVLLEAMASEVLVIATNVGGVSELVKDQQTGLLVSSENVAELKDVMVNVLRNKKGYQHMIANAKGMVTEKFGLNEMVCAIERLYQELLGAEA